MFTDKNNTQNSSDIEVASQEETPKKDDSQKSLSQEIKIEEVKAEGEVKEEPINEEVPKTSIKEITDENFQEKVLKSSKPFCLKFEADWCKPCKILTSMIEEISNELTDINFGAMNVESQPNTPTAFGIRALPTCILWVGGELKSTKLGMTKKSEFIKWIKENL